MSRVTCVQHAEVSSQSEFVRNLVVSLMDFLPFVDVLFLFNLGSSGFIKSLLCVSEFDDLGSVGIECYTPGLDGIVACEIVRVDLFSMQLQSFSIEFITVNGSQLELESLVGKLGRHLSVLTSLHVEHHIEVSHLLVVAE